MSDRLTFIDDGRVVDVPARFSGGTVRLQPADVAKELGWELKTEGLCRGSLCVPVRNAPDLANGDGIALDVLARVLARPLAIDVDERAAYMAASAAERGARLASLQAPDFTLPDLSRRMHSLADYRGNKILLIAYASW
jgi:hypothetical protein